MKREVTVCDACGVQINDVIPLSWERRPSVFTATCPIDGINGGVWSMDVCADCRTSINLAISATINSLRKKGDQ